MAIVIDTHVIVWYIRATVPEMPDRIIAATALHLNAPLITRDHKIQALQNVQTLW